VLRQQRHRIKEMLDRLGRVFSQADQPEHDGHRYPVHRIKPEQAFDNEAAQGKACLGYDQANHVARDREEEIDAEIPPVLERRDRQPGAFREGAADRGIGMEISHGKRSDRARSLQPLKLVFLLHHAQSYLTRQTKMAVSQELCKVIEPCSPDVRRRHG